jgi:acyl-coenzyme A synthetase/AMP-(fatty) acid ligase
MGDLGWLEADGCLRFFDRAADAVVVDGRRVSAFRVEDALHWHPDVADVAVVLVPDGGTGRLVAAVEPLRPVTEAELAAFAADRLAPHEVPSRIVTVDSLPRGGLDKVLKRRLRADLAAT